MLFSQLRTEAGETPKTDTVPPARESECNRASVSCQGDRICLTRRTPHFVVGSPAIQPHSPTPGFRRDGAALGKSRRKLGGLEANGCSPPLTPPQRPARHPRTPPASFPQSPTPAGAPLAFAADLITSLYSGHCCAGCSRATPALRGQHGPAMRFLVARPQPKALACTLPRNGRTSRILGTPACRTEDRPPAATNLVYRTGP